LIHGTCANIFYSAIGLVVYLYIAYCLREIARKRGYSHPWFAWVPILDVYLLCRMAEKGVFWTILCLLPIVDVIFLAIIFVKLARVLHHNRWYGLLLLVPVVNYVVLWDLSFGLRHSLKAAAASG